MFDACIRVRVVSTGLPRGIVITSSFTRACTNTHGRHKFAKFIVSGGRYRVIPVTSLPVLSHCSLGGTCSGIGSGPGTFVCLVTSKLSNRRSVVLADLCFVEPSFGVVNNSTNSAGRSRALVCCNDRHIGRLYVFISYGGQAGLIGRGVCIPAKGGVLIAGTSPVGQYICAFGGQPTSRRCTEVLNVPLCSLRSTFVSRPLKRGISNRLFVGSPRGVGRSRSVAFCSRVVPGGFVSILKLNSVGRVVTRAERGVNVGPDALLSVGYILESLCFGGRKG